MRHSRIASLFLLAASLLLAADGDWQSEGVVSVAHSPYAKLHAVPIHAVKMGDGFWSARRATNVEKSIPTLLAELEQHGVVANFLRLEGKKDVPRRGPLYTDSDLYKWMEAVAFVLQSGDQPKLRAEFDRLTGIILAAQEPSGYLNTYWTEERTPKRFTEMYRSHELYCIGHLIQAAIAYYRATGDRKLLDGGIRFANYMVENFGPQKRPALTGHPEFEMALVELYRTTGDRRYLDFAGYLLSGVERERLHLTADQITYLFSGKPFTSRTEFEGHAVRAMYASSGATDYYMETGDPAYLKTLETLWRDLVNGKMYITGGVGSREAGEAFGEAYELPTAQAYGESCAAIGNMMWNWRMLLALGESRFADVMERALYNGINSGMSLSGTLYCYRNPLESSGEKIRNEWYDTTCCPPNMERILASLPGYLYSTGPKGVYVNLFHTSTLDRHPHCAANRIPVERRGGSDGRSGACGRVQPVRAHPGLVGWNHRWGQGSRAFFYPARHAQGWRIFRDSSPVEARRQDAYRVRNETAAGARQSPGARRRRPRGAGVRTAGLLPGATRSARIQSV